MRLDLAGVGQRLNATVRWLELALATGVLLAVVAAALGTGRELRSRPWTEAATYDYLLARVLFLAIGLELVRMMVAHSLLAILELLAFAIARKMLAPEISALDLAMSAAGFVALLAGQRYFLPTAPAPEMPREEAA
jgi:hypothetical protein